MSAHAGSIATILSLWDRYPPVLEVVSGIAAQNRSKLCRSRNQLGGKDLTLLHAAQQFLPDGNVERSHKAL